MSRVHPSNCGATWPVPVFGACLAIANACVALLAAPPTAAAQGHQEPAVSLLDEAYIFTALGASANNTLASSQGRVERGASALLAHYAASYMTVGSLSSRHSHFAELGGGSLGLEGGIGADVALGWRPALGPRHGPVLRGGARAYLAGNDVLYASLVEVPQAQVGYQLLSPCLHLEAAGRVGFAAVARQRSLDEARRLDGALDVGGYLAAGAGGVDWEFDLSQIGPAQHGAPPLNQITTSFCAVFGAPFDGSETRTVACFRARLDDALSARAGPSASLGIWVGIGPSQVR